MKVIGIYFPTSLICFIVNMNMNLQTSRSCSEFSPLCGILYGCQRSAVPTACNLGKEPVFYWIELGAIRWIVDDHDVHSESVCQIHEVLLDNFVGTGIGSAPVTEKHHSAGGWIYVMQMFLPHPFYVVTYKFRGVMVTSDSDISRVASYVIYPVRNNFRLCKCFKIMIETSWGSIGKHFPRSFEVSDELFLLGVDTEHGYAGLHAFCLDLFNNLELVIALWDLLQRRPLYKGPLTQTENINDLAYNIVCDCTTIGSHPCGYLRDAKRNPHNLPVLGKPSGMRLHNTFENFYPFRVSVEFALTASTFSPDSARFTCVAVFTFFYAGIDSLLVNSEKFANFAHTVTSASHSLRCHITSFLTFIERRHKISIFLIELSWRRFRSQLNNTVS